MDNLQRCYLRTFCKFDCICTRFIGCVLCGPIFRFGVPVANLLHGRLFGAVGKDDTVSAECVVTLPIIKVSAVP